MRDRWHLVVVLPGIGGSVLARAGDPDDVVWDAGKGDIADLVVRPDRMSVAESPRLEPIGLTRSTKFLGFTVVPGYERLLEQLDGYGKVDRRGDPERPLLDADVVAVPYDFRRSIVEAAERLDTVVRAHLDGSSEAQRAARVIVVAHSMGGLVARYWMGPLGRWLWCRALITLGTPHRGAPKALDWLVNGVHVGGLRLAAPSRLLRDWPGVAQLLPCYPAVRDLTADEADAVLYPYELPVDCLGESAKNAYDLHGDIERSWMSMPRAGPEIVPCIGWSHPTLDASFWNGLSLEVRKCPPDWLELSARWIGDFGDGSVPAVSALPPELDNYLHSPIRLTDRHVPMACSSRTLQLIAHYEESRPPARIHGDEGNERRPAIGLDVTDVHASGQPIPVTVTLREVDAELSRQAVWATLRPTVKGPVAGKESMRLDWDSDQACFYGELPGRPQGLYALRVTAREVPGAGDLEAVDTLAVIDGE